MKVGSLVLILIGGLLVFFSGVLLGGLIVNSALTESTVKAIYTPIAHKALMGYPIVSLFFGIAFLVAGSRR